MRMTMAVPFEIDSPDYKAIGVDTDELAKRGRRVMVKRDCDRGEVALFVAPEGEVKAGWVVAVEVKGKAEEKQMKSENKPDGISGLAKFIADKAEAAPAPAPAGSQHTVPPESLQTIQRILNNAGESLRYTKEAESSDCFEGARRLTIIADERAALVAALREMTQYVDASTQHGRWTDIEWGGLITQARAALAEVERGAFKASGCE